jgi:hypothetical protein
VTSDGCFDYRYLVQGRWSQFGLSNYGGLYNGEAIIFSKVKVEKNQPIAIEKGVISDK